MSDYTSWKVDDKIVCVGKSGVKGRRSPTEREARPSVGSVYTIRDIFPWGDTVVVRLVEIVNTPRLYRGADGTVRESELSYFADCFRPVAKRPTSIAIFERIRDNPKAPIIEPSPKQRERV